MNNLSDIKRRLASVRQTRQITGAMETISVAKMRKSLARLTEDRAYYDTLCGIMNELISRGGEDISRFCAAPEGGKDYIIIVSSDKGLCGGFNHNVLKYSDGIIKRDSVVIPIGHAACKYYNDVTTEPLFAGLNSVPEHAKAKRIADFMINGFGNTVGSVTVIFTAYISASSFEPRTLKLLPLEKDAAEGMFTPDSSFPSLFEPSADDVFRTLLPMYIGGLIYGTLMQSYAAEHSARHVAMSSSTSNADALIEALELEYNRARQGSVTEQITEIIGSTRVIGGGNVQ